MKVNEEKRNSKKPQRLVKIKKVFRVVKDIWSNKQYKATIKLFLYFIFMTIVLFLIQSQSNSNKNIKAPKTALEEFSEITKYKYQTNITNDLITIIVNGEKTDLTNEFIIGNKKYVLENDKLYLVDGQNKIETFWPFDIDITRLTPTNLYNMINDLEEISTTSYKTGEHEKKYEVPIKSFEKIYSGKDINSDLLFNISTFSKDSIIKKVEIDLSNYMKINHPTINIYKIIIIFEELN